MNYSKLLEGKTLKEVFIIHADWAKRFNRLYMNNYPWKKQEQLSRLIAEMQDRLKFVSDYFLETFQ